MIEIASHAELVTRCQGDTLCLWAARGLDGRSRAWRSADGTALVVAGTDLSTRDRITLLGSAGGLVPLVRDVLGEVGPTYRPLGDPPLTDALVAALPELKRGATFGWMDGRAPAEQPPSDAAADAGGPRWLADPEISEVTGLLDSSYASSDARPGVAGVERWAGIRDQSGHLVATAALAWSAPEVGYLAGVAVDPDSRGRGLGAAICGFVLAEALREHGAAALMVDEWNDAAIRLYQKLGLRYRPVAAAAVAAV